MNISGKTLHNRPLTCLHLQTILKHSALLQLQTILQFPKHILDVLFGDSTSPVLTRAGTFLMLSVPGTRAPVNGTKEEQEVKVHLHSTSQACALTRGCLRKEQPSLIDTEMPMG